MLNFGACTPCADIQTLRYLRTVYEGDWLAFRERLLQQQGVKEALSRPDSGKPTVHDIEEASFLPGNLVAKVMLV